MYRLAFALSLYFPYGGLQRDLLRIAKTCVARGHEVHIYTGEWQGDRPGDISVHQLDTRALTNHGSNKLLAKGLAEATARERFDCITGFTKMAGLDIYYAADPCYAVRAENTKSWLYRLLPRYHGLRRQEAAVFHVGGSAEILLIAHHEQAKFIKYYGSEKERFHILPPGIDKSRLQSQVPDEASVRQLRAEFGVGSEDKLILAVGSRFRTKGVDRMIHAIAALPETLGNRIRLVVIGHGDSRPYQRLATKLGIGAKVDFVGTRGDVARFYYSADLLLHPSYSENTGTVLLEAMVCGLPVLTTENCGFAFHVTQAQAGLVCPEPFRQLELNHLLEQILTSTEQAVWRTNGPEYCERTDVEGLVERASDIILARAERNRKRHDNHQG